MKNILKIGLLFFLFGCVSATPKVAHNGSILGSFGSRTAYRDWSDLRRASFDLDTKTFYEATAALAEKYPNEHVFKIYEAALLGDYGQTLSEKEEKTYKKKAVAKIEPYTRMKFQSPISFDALLTFNEYYYHRGDYLKQYEFGKQTKRLGGPGNFSIGVGGVMWALELARAKKCMEAKTYAQEALDAWETIKSENELAHTPFYIAAIALSGSCEKAQKVFDEDLTDSDRYKEAPRWMQQFNPKNIPCC